MRRLYHVLTLSYYLPENYLKQRGRKLQGSRVAILGLAFKADVSDTRNSASVKMADLLIQRGAKVTAHDPLAPRISLENDVLESTVDLESAPTNSEIIILLTPHASFRAIQLSEIHKLVHADTVIVDTRGFWSPNERTGAGFSYFGLGRP